MRIMAWSPRRGCSFVPGRRLCRSFNSAPREDEEPVRSFVSPVRHNIQLILVLRNQQQDGTENFFGPPTLPGWNLVACGARFRLTMERQETLSLTGRETWAPGRRKWIRYGSLAQAGLRYV